MANGNEYLPAGKAFTQNLKTGFAESLDGKIREALGLGVPQADIDKILKNNAMRARNADVRGTLLGAGLRGAGKAQQNQAGLITQAGLQNQTFTPGDSGLGSVGEGLTQAGKADARYQKEITRIDEAELKRAEAKAKELDEDGAVKEKAIKLASQAKFLVASAGKAGDIINGHVAPDEAKLEAQGKGFFGDLWDTAKKTGGAIVSTVAGGLQSTRNIRQEALERYVAAELPESYKAYTRLSKLSNQMVFPILESGTLGVNPTDADVDLARKATFDISARSDTWLAQLDDIIAQARGNNLAKAGVDKVKKLMGDKKVETKESVVSNTNTEKKSVVDSIVDSGWKILE